MSEVASREPHGSLFAGHIAKRVKLFTSPRSPSRLQSALRAAAIGTVFASSVAAAGYEAPQLSGQEGRGLQMAAGPGVPASVSEAFWDGAQASGLLMSKVLKLEPEYPEAETNWEDGSIRFVERQQLAEPEYDHAEGQKFDLMIDYEKAVHFLALPQEVRVEMAATTARMLALGLEYEVSQKAAELRQEAPGHPLLVVLGERSQMPDVSDPLWDAVTEHIPSLNDRLRIARLPAEDLAAAFEKSQASIVRQAEKLGFSAPADVPAFGKAKLERNMRSLQEQISGMDPRLDQVPQEVGLSIR